MAITTSPYINGPDILEHATRTVKEVHLDFSSVADGCIKAGSPISAAGKVANDATAIGILLHDNYSDCGCGHGMVVVAGRIRADVAEQHSGIKISAEAKGGMPAVAFVDAAGIVTGGGNAGGSTPGGGGVTSWNDLTDKPFYEATEMVRSDIVEEGSYDASYEEGTGPYMLLGVSASHNYGEAVTVVFDEKKYPLNYNGKKMYSDFEGAAYFGNASMMDSNLPDTGEPFVFTRTIFDDGYTPSEGDYIDLYCGYAATYGAHNIHIYKDAEQTVVKTLDEKFIPENVATKEFVEESKFAVTDFVVSTDGDGNTYVAYWGENSYQARFATMSIAVDDIGYLYPMAYRYDSWDERYYVFVDKDGGKHTIKVDMDNNATYVPAT